MTPFDGLKFSLIKEQGDIVGVLIDTEHNYLWTSLRPEDTLPLRVVPTVYDQLSKIAEEVAGKYPEADIHELFEFVSNQTRT